MILREKQLDYLKKNVHSLAELKETLKSRNISFTEEEANELYSDLTKLSDADLEDVNGGWWVEPKHIVGCPKCHTNVKCDKDGSSTRCPKCGTLTNINNGYYGC